MNAKLPYFYETEVEWTWGRSGELRSSGLPTIEVSAPPEFHGHEAMWTPEHLFVASVNSCFMATFAAIADMSKLEFVSFDCRAVGMLEKVEGRGFLITEILLKPKVVVRHERDLERAVRILDKSERNCLISNSINTMVRLEPAVEFEQVEDRLPVLA